MHLKIYLQLCSLSNSQCSERIKQTHFRHAKVSKNVQPINPPWETIEGYNVPNREVNQESSSYGAQETEVGRRNKQAEGEQKSQDKSYAPVVEMRLSWPE